MTLLIEVHELVEAIYVKTTRLKIDAASARNLQDG